MGGGMGSLSRAPHFCRYQRSGSRLDGSLRGVTGISRVSQVGRTRRVESARCDKAMNAERLSFTLLPFPLGKGPGVRSYGACNQTRWRTAGVGGVNAALREALQRGASSTHET